MDTTKYKKIGNIPSRLFDRMVVGRELGTTFDIFDYEKMKIYTFEVVYSAFTKCDPLCAMLSLQECSNDILNLDGLENRRLRHNVKEFIGTEKIWPCALTGCPYDMGYRVRDDGKKIPCRIYYKVISTEDID